MGSVRRGLVAVATLLLVLVGASACGGDSGPGSSSRTVTLVGQNFTEADIITQLYKLLLDKQGFETRVKNLGARDIYLGPLEKGQVQISADYLSSLTEALNRKANGADAAPVATPDVTSTLAQLRTFGQEYGITPLEPARAEDANAFAVTRAFASKYHLSTLSDLGGLGRPIALAANSDCAARPDCGKGLKSVYGIDLARIEPLGFGSQDTKNALTKAEVQLGQVGTSDGSLDQLGLVVLRDDKNWQNAENLVPVVNSHWLKAHPKARTALDRLSGVLTTEDLKTMNEKVDAQRLGAGKVAEEYLKDKGLL